MLVKQTSKEEIKKLITLIRQAVLNKRNWLVMPKQKYRYENILRILFDQGFIEGYEEMNDLLIIRLRQQYWKNPVSPITSIVAIKPFVRVRRKSTIEARDISKFQRLSGQTWDFIISTDKGIILEKDNKRNWCGGLPLFRIL